MNRSLFALSLLAALASCTGETVGGGGDEPPADAGTPTVDDAGTTTAVCAAPPRKTLTAAPAPITRGSASPTELVLSEGQQLAVGALLTPQRRGRWVNSCTATLVAPRIVLSAAHCVSAWRGPIDPSQVRFGVGPDMANPLRTFDVDAIHVHPEYGRTRNEAEHDVSVLILSESATEALPEIMPIKVNREPLPSELVGTNVQTVGYGVTETNDSNTKKWWTTEVVAALTRYDVTVDGKGQSAVCYGDSGGPLLHVMNGEVRTLGTLSWGDPSCFDKDHFARVDDSLEWIEGAGVAGPLPGSNAPECDDAQPATCAGATLHACTGGKRTVTDCAAAGQICAQAQDGRFDCIPDPCAGVTGFGSCDGSVAVWCDNHVLKRADCGACGLSCAYVDGNTGMFCR